MTDDFIKTGHSEYIECTFGQLKLRMLGRIAQIKHEVKDIDDSNCDAHECRRLMITTYHDMISCIDKAIESSKAIGGTTDG